MRAMRDASAFESLGLSPGADQAAIERAYKKLIKEHHPDREGGNSARAAEINRAYRELRPRHELADPLELNDDPFERPRGFGGPVWVAVLTCGIVALLAAATPIGAALRDWAPASAHSIIARPGAGSAVDPMGLPLHPAAIAAAIQDASHLGTTRDEMSLAAESNDCHRRMRSRPDLVQLDRCAAFDDAVVVLQDRDPLRDRGPFSELAVTGRQWSSASSLSSDYLAIDGRLDRIRVQVEMALADSAAAKSD
jgi:hypothetical protein